MSVDIGQFGTDGQAARRGIDCRGDISYPRVQHLAAAQWAYLRGHADTVTGGVFLALIADQPHFVETRNRKSLRRAATGGAGNSLPRPD